MSTRTVLHEADIARALTRISHEILESNKGPDGLVLLGIPTRGVALAHRIAAPRSRISAAASVPVGALDVTMYRDDLHRNPTRAPQPTSIPAGGIDGKVVVLVDDVLFSGRSIRAALDALQDIGRPAAVRLADAHRPRPPRAAHPARLRRQEPAQRARRARATCAWPRSTAKSSSRSRRARHHEAPARYEDPVADGRARHPRRRRGHGRHAAARGQEAAHAARQDGREPVLRGLHPHPDLVRGRGEAAERRRHQLLGEGLERLEGRVAAGHGTDARRRWGRMPSSSVTAPRARRARWPRAAGSPRGSSTPATGRTSIRRRRCWTRSRCASAGTAPTAAAGTSSGMAVTIVGDILHSRVARSNVWLLDTLGAEVTLVAPADARAARCVGLAGARALRPRRGHRGRPGRAHDAADPARADERRVFPH